MEKKEMIQEMKDKLQKYWVNEELHLPISVQVRSRSMSIIDEVAEKYKENF